MESNEERAAALIAKSTLVGGDGHHYSSRRERIAAHLMAALIVGSNHSVLSLSRQHAREDLVTMALELTDTLIVQLAEDSNSLTES